MFSAQCTVVPKKYRKKLKKKYLYKIIYIDQNKRQNLALREIFFFLKTFKSHSVKDRYFLMLCDIIFNFKNSLMYKKKILMYKKLFKH